jgi:hypothetical protein
MEATELMEVAMAATEVNTDEDGVAGGRDARADRAQGGIRILSSSVRAGVGAARRGEPWADLEQPAWEEPRQARA